MAVSKSNWSVSLSLLFCPVWMLFLLFNIIGSSPAWFVSKKKGVLSVLFMKASIFFFLGNFIQGFLWSLVDLCTQIVSVLLVRKTQFYCFERSAQLY